MFALRKRLDGGYTIARRNANIADITPDSFRLLLDYLPTLRKNYGEVRLRLGRRFLEEWRIRRRWSLDEATPFEAVRVLDPAPKQVRPGRGAQPPCRAPSRPSPTCRWRGSWAGMMDVTPDAVPVIDQVARIPGFFIATGFSGHGFGIGPGAGRLMADLVAGDAPVVDPSPFRLDRFARAR